MSKYINPFTDYGFKKLFGEEGSKKNLINFLNALLVGKDKIVKLSFKKNEQQGETVISRKTVYDIFCEDEKGSQFIVEMQNAKQLYFKDRAIYYSTFPIRDQGQKGEWNFKLKAVYCVGLMGFEFEKETNKNEEEILIEEKEYVEYVQLKNQRNKVFYDKLTFIFIELVKFDKKESELENNFEKWLYFLKNLENFEDIPEVLKEESFEEAFKTAEIANFSKEEHEEYEESLKNYRDNINVITTAKEEGREEKAIRIAEKMLIRGDSVEDIADITELSIAKILEIMNNKKTL